MEELGYSGDREKKQHIFFSYTLQGLAGAFWTEDAQEMVLLKANKLPDITSVCCFCFR